MRRWREAIITFMNRLDKGGFWFAIWLYRALLITFAGGLIGLIVGSLVKGIFLPNTSWGTSLKVGFITGCEYAGIWATGIALVWVVMDHKRMKAALAAYLGKQNTPTS